jgi:hypothetical protein
MAYLVNLERSFKIAIEARAVREWSAALSAAAGGAPAR